MPATVGDRASIEISIDREPSRKWTTSAPADDGATVSGLPPATYYVVVTLLNGVRAEIRVPLEANEVVSLELIAAPAGAGWQLRVADRHRQSHGTHFDGTILRRLPTGAGLWGVLDMAAPFVVVDRIDGGGLGLATPGRVGSRGAAWSDTSIRLGEFRLAQGPTDADQTGMIPSLDNFEAVVVSSGLARTDVASPGATISLVPKRPSAARQGAIDVSFTPSAFVSTNASAAAPAIARLESWRSAGLQFGGPVTPRVGFFVSGSATSTRERERRATRSLSSGLASVFAHVVAHPGDRTQLRTLGSLQRATQPYRPLRSIVPDARERDLFLQSQVAWEHHTSNGSRLEAAFGYQRTVFTPAAIGVQSVALDRLSDGLVPGPISNARVGTSEVRLLFAPAERRRHMLEMGLSLSHSRSTSSVLAMPRIEESVAGYPARVWLSESPLSDSQKRATHIAGYINDRVRLGPRATVDLGLRLSESTGSALGSAGRISWTALMPRVGLRWSPRPITLFAGYGWYQPELPLRLLAFGDPGEPLRKVHRWADANADGIFQTAEAGPLVAVAGRAPSAASIDSSLESPRTSELTFGAERQFGSSVVLSATGTIRREHGIPRSVNTGVPASSYQVHLLPDQGVFYDSADDDRLLPVYDRLPQSFGQDHFVLSNVDDDEASYEGIEIAVAVTRPRWWSFAGASAYRSEVSGGNRGFQSDQNDQGVIGEIFENPNANSYPFGRSFFDRAYVLKWATGFAAAHGFGGTVVARYQDGQPFSRLVVVPDLAQGAELVSAYPAGRTRFTFTATIDARLEKRFGFGRRQAAVRLELYNLTNHGLEVEENPLTGVDFRRTTAVQPPRTLRLGFHVAF